MYNKLWHEMLNNLDDEIKKSDFTHPMSAFQAATLIAFKAKIKSMENEAIGKSLLEAGY